MRKKKRFLDAPARNTWRVITNVLGWFLVSFIFVYVLNKYSERSGSIILVTDPPRGSNFTDRTIDGLRVMRIALGQPISYDITWHYIEGGCETLRTLEFEQISDKPPRTTVLLAQKGRNFPIGSPGLDHINRPQPPGLFPGLWKYASVITATCANGRKPSPDKVAEFYIDIYDTNTPVFSVLSEPLLFNSVLREGDAIHWKMSVRRNLDGKSTAIYTFISQDAKNPDVVIFQKPAAYEKVGDYPDSDTFLNMPEGITPGKWKMQASNVTNLPGGKVQTDVLFEIELEVTS